MYRIKFVRLCHIQKKQIVEHGPWQPSMYAVEKWMHYFSTLPHSGKIEIECLVNGRAFRLHAD
jgi:hypothetical protein